MVMLKSTAGTEEFDTVSRVGGGPNRNELEQAAHLVTHGIALLWDQDDTGMRLTHRQQLAVQSIEVSRIRTTQEMGDVGARSAPTCTVRSRKQQ